MQFNVKEAHDHSFYYPGVSVPSLWWFFWHSNKRTLDKGAKLGMGPIRPEGGGVLSASGGQAAGCVRDHLHYYFCTSGSCTSPCCSPTSRPQGSVRVHGQPSRRASVTTIIFPASFTENACSPLYSDVEFLLPQRTKSAPRRIYAARRLLNRVDYFDASQSY